MIFVTVGTHEQQFNRLIKEIDLLRKKNIIKEEVIIQTGFSSYIPEYCEYKKFFSYTEMSNLMEKARKIITHGGPSTFMEVINKGKVPIVVPRQSNYGEHVNNHQLEFASNVLKINYPIVVIDKIEEIEKIINTDLKFNHGFQTNNRKFNEELSKIVFGVLGGKI